MDTADCPLEKARQACLSMEYLDAKAYAAQAQLKGVTNSKFLIIVLEIFLLPKVTSNGERDFYQVLGIKRSSTDEEIDKAYKDLRWKVHPDKNMGLSVANEVFLLVTNATQTLLHSRAAYDQSLPESEAPPEPTPSANRFFFYPTNNNNYNNESLFSHNSPPTSPVHHHNEFESAPAVPSTAYWKPASLFARTSHQTTTRSTRSKPYSPSRNKSASSSSSYNTPSSTRSKPYPNHQPSRSTHSASSKPPSYAASMYRTPSSTRSKPYPNHQPSRSTHSASSSTRSKPYPNHQPSRSTHSASSKPPSYAASTTKAQSVPSSAAPAGNVSPKPNNKKKTPPVRKLKFDENDLLHI